MHCEEIRELLSLYIDNMLDAEELDEVLKHLSNCSQCQQELEELKMTMELITSMEEITPPPSFRKEVINRLEKNEEVINNENQDKEVFQVLDMKAYKEKFKKITTHNMFLGSALAACIILVLFSFKYVQFGHNPIALHSYGGSENSIAESKSVADVQSTPAKPESSNRVDSYNPNTLVDAGRDLDNNTAMKKATESYGSTIQRKVIKNAVINMETKEFNKTINALDKIVENKQGYYEKKDINTQGNKSGSFIIKIPANIFSGVMKEFEKIGNVLNTSTSSSDVTSDYYDTETRIGVLQRQEIRLLEILNKAKNVEEVLKVEEQLVRIREEIETNQGHLKLLNNSIELSTLTVEIHEVQEITIVQPPTGVKGTFILAQDAFRLSIKSLLSFLKGSVIFVGGAIPFIVILSLVGGGYYYYKKKSNKE